MYAHRLQDAVRNFIGLTEYASPPSFRHLESSAEATFTTVSETSALNVYNPARHTNCSLDIVNDKLVSTNAFVPLHNSLSIQGWIVNSDTQVPRQFDLLLVNGSDIYSVKARSGLSRPDVAKALHFNAASTAGFSIEAQSNDMSPGTYRVVISLTNNGGVETCDTTKLVVLGHANLK